MEAPTALPATASQKTPAAGQKAPAAGQKAPAAGQKTPAAGQKAPAAGQKTPAAGQKTPAERRPYKGGRVETGPPLKCAWVVLLMIGKAYTPGALVVAQSLRQMRTKHDLVCLVTPDIPGETQDQLALVYDHIVTVPYIEHKARRFAAKKQAEMYEGWAERSFTKWNCLTLTEYDRVALVDADLAFVANVDDLFELRTPAACYSLPWAYPWQVVGGIRNPYLVCQPGQEAMCDLPHGSRIKAATIMKALYEPTFVGGAALVVLQPSQADFDRVLAVINEKAVYGQGQRTTSGPDEASLAEAYAREGVDWTHIHQRYQALPWKPSWVSRDIRGYHFLGRKPWDQNPDEWPDLAIWWRIADELVSGHPSLREVFYPPVTAVAPLDADAAQLHLTNDVRALILTSWKQTRARARRRDGAWHELDNILERWLLALANAPDPDRSRAPWARVYYHTTLEESFNNKLAGELAEKGLVAPTEEAGALVLSVLALVDHRLSQPPRPSGARASCDKESVSYGSHFRADCTPRLTQLIELKGCELATAAALRYAVILSAGQQWGLPMEHVNWLYRNFNVRGEAFASPFNARLLGKPQAAFCSLFLDTDGPFGSLGDFFALPPDGFHSRNWVINPPFIEALMERAALLVTRLLSPEHEQTVFFIIPDWTDSEAYKLLHGCPYTVAEVKLNPGEYFYEDPAGRRMNTKASSIYFALSTEALDVLNRLEGALLHIRA